MRTRRVGVPAFALAVPAWAWIVFFFLAPVSLVFWYSFGEKPGLFGTHDNSTLSFDRYAEALDSAYLPTYVNTLRVGLLGTALCLLIGLPFAYWIAAKVSPRWRGLLIGLVMIPYWTNFLVRTLGWTIVLAPNGSLSRWLQDVGFIGGPLDVLDTRFAVQLGVVYNYLPLMILPLYVAIERVDPALREASRDLGAGRWRTFTQVTFPLAQSGIVAGLLLVFIPLMGDYVTATVLGGAKGNMVGQLVASQFQSAQNWALGSAMSVVLIVFIVGSMGALAAMWWALGTAARARTRLVFDVPAAPGAPVPVKEK